MKKRGLNVPDKKIRASIVGITGYTGLELFRVLTAHPHVEIVHTTGRDMDELPLSIFYPHLSQFDLYIEDYDLDLLVQDSDVVFVALPHMAAQDIVAELHGRVKVVDLSADYRLDHEGVYQQYYGVHKHPHLLKDVIYGLPEINRNLIKGATTVANPGCFALLCQLMLWPFAGKIQNVNIMAVTGSSGAGKKTGDGTHHPIRNHNMKSYNINTHRHISEIVRTAQIEEGQLNFVPTSGPYTRGIFATAFVTTDGTEPDNAFDVFKDEYFIRMRDNSGNVELAHVVASNFCDLSCIKIKSGQYIVQGALDNLVKGAAGCAVQNMNLMFGLNETEGLKTLTPLYP
jgi:N-acetyl-gamma-glutamyl-phosphate reductase